MTSRELDSYEGAYQESFEFHDENIEMLSWYVEYLMRSIKLRGARSLLSLGVGHEVVSRKLIAGVGATLERYVIVEGSIEILERFKASLDLPSYLCLEHAWFEEYKCEVSFDTIEMGFILEHVEDPAVVVNRYKEMLAPGGRMYVAVPNALSLHRRIGHEAGLLADMYALSDADLELGHRRYFDLQSLSQLLGDCGVDIVDTHGVFLKPFSTGQLRSLGLTSNVLDALYRVGANIPELCNAILVEARVR